MALLLTNPVPHRGNPYDAGFSRNDFAKFNLPAGAE
jgi:hypothetical protein